MQTAYAAYRSISSDINKAITRTADAPAVKREVDYFKANIEKIKTIDDFLKNDRVFRFAMKAYGLSDMSYAKGFIRKILTEGVDASGAMANRLKDTRYREFAKAFNFAKYGEFATSFAAAKSGAVERYLRQTLEETAGASNEGVRLALYFKRTAPNLKTTYGILADPALYKVAQVVLGLPEGQRASVDAQQKLIDRKMSLADLKDPAKLERLLTRFTAIYDAKYASPAPAESLLSGSSPGLSLDLLFTLQGVKR